MIHETYSHLVEINEEKRLLTIYRVSGSERYLYTSVEIPQKTWENNPEEFEKFCQTLGENIIFDSPQARKLLGI
jgi:hypothetical protein